jgi:hypothetical protein
MGAAAAADGGYSLHLDLTVLERFGEQEGSLKGNNSRKHGRPSHHRCSPWLPNLTLFSTVDFAAATAESASEQWSFSKKPSRIGDQRQKMRLVRADSGSWTTSC